MKSVGFVIPVYQEKFILKLVKNLKRTANRSDTVFCIVNDGKQELEELIESVVDGELFISLHLTETKNFSGANNAGWKYLIQNYPEIDYLGSLNDDTVPYKNWLNPLVTKIKSDPTIGVVSPQLIEKSSYWPFLKEYKAIWTLRNPSGMDILQKRIEKDTFVSALTGFCFLSKKMPLQEVGFLDEAYRNGCEDIDLGIKLLESGYRILVVRGAKVFHLGSQSRYLPGTNTDLNFNHSLFQKNHGVQIERYNNLRHGFYENESK